MSKEKKSAEQLQKELQDILDKYKQNHRMKLYLPTGVEYIYY